MADNVYIYENYSADVLPTPDATDDGTGTDWIVINGTYNNRTISLSYTELLGTAIGNTQVTYTAFIGDAVRTLYVVINGVIENARGGAGAENILGSFQANILQGDMLDVAGGNDTISGERGNDTIVGAGGSDRLSGGENDDLVFGDVDPFSPEETNYVYGNDTLFGGAGNDRLYGGWGNNVLNGDAGTDTADYSGFFDDFGNTTYRIVANMELGEVQVYSQDTFGGPEVLIGTDQLSGIEVVIGTAGADSLTASAFFDPLVDTLDPVLYGGDGNDTLLGGPVRDALYGGDGNDLLFGFSGTAVDAMGIMDGGRGNDSYYLFQHEEVAEALDGGHDTVNAYVNHTLSANFESLFLFGTAANGTGNDLGNQIFGNASANQLSGLAGQDSIRGRGGNDSLQGDAGNDSLFGEGGNDRLLGGADNDSLVGSDGRDTLIGGTGRDILIGGTGADRFQFVTSLDSSETRLRDIIKDFVSGLDKIDLSPLATGAMFIGAAGFSGSGPAEVRYNKTTGILWADTDGDGFADMSFALGAGTTLVSTDLLL